MKINVANKKIIRRISLRHMQAAKTRNIIAVTAIALTTILFTVLFTIMMSVVYGYEQSNFRQLGGYYHGGFKNLTSKQFEDLCTDPFIVNYGVRRFIGIPTEAPFNKLQTEISWMDENNAKWSYLEPVSGHLPTEGTHEAATDTLVLSQLGIEPEIGAKFTVAVPVGGVTTTQEFTLCGYWEYDAVSPAHHILISESYAQEILTALDTQSLNDMTRRYDGITGRYTLNVMLKTSSNIEESLLTILERHGYQTGSPEEDNYIDIGVNWGYLGVRINNFLDFGTLLSIAAMLLLIIFTGYLIIYNIFQISVSNDIHFYGLLKTIGTTGRQIKRIITIQALLLSAIGIPVGILAGYGIGALLTPVVLSTLNVYNALSANPVIFIGSALFSLITVFISCNKPGRLASKVSPIEAIRYTDAADIRSKKKRGNTKSGASLYQMAWANLGRNRKKTIITVLSLSLSVVLLNITAAVSQSFDLNKYLDDVKGVVSDFILADARYFRTGTSFEENWNVADDAITALWEQGGITGGGRTYGFSGSVQEFITEEDFRLSNHYLYSEASANEQLDGLERINDRVPNPLQLYGMESFCLDKLHVIAGDLTKLKENTDSRYIAAVCYCDSYGNIRENSHHVRPGDTVYVRYVDEAEIYNTLTGEIYPDVESIPNTDLPYADVRILSYRDMEYEVAALVELPNSLSYRYFNSGFEYILDAETFIKDTGTNAVMYYTFDVADEKTEAIEQYSADLTNTAMPQLQYESRKTYTDAFDAFTRMYSLCGNALSFVVGLVGILNFLNAVLTSIMSRQREFALLASVGMSGRQLKTMLIAEGVLLSLSAIFMSCALTLATIPLVSNVGSMFSFFVYHFTLLPLTLVTPAFILLGILLPTVTYRLTSTKSIVERLREV